MKASCQIKAASNKRMHATADTRDVIDSRGAGRRVMRGVGRLASSGSPKSMKTSGLVLILVCLAGAWTSGGTQRPEPQPSGDSLSVEEAREVGRKAPCLKAGMSPEEVFDILGAKVAGRESRGGGPGWDFRVVYPLREGYGLLLVWDEGRRFKRSEVLGEGWGKGPEGKSRREGCKDAPGAGR
jgi:hypothetical protein